MVTECSLEGVFEFLVTTGKWPGELIHEAVKVILRDP